MPNQTHIKALERAAELTGDPAQLAHDLGIPLPSLMLFMQGKVDLSAELFVRVVDLILQADLKSLRDPFVLVVEDDPATAYSFSRLIKQLGYRVETAADGQSALEHIRERQPLVAFIDLRLPDVSGWEIAEIVRAEGLTTKIVAVTAYGASEEDRNRSLAAGFEEHFAKPLDTKRLETVIPRRL